jgi:integrase
MGYRKRGDSYEVNVAYKGERAFATVASESEAKDKLVELKAGLIQAHRKKTGVLDVQTSRPEQVVATSWTLGAAISKTFEVRWTGSKSESFYKTKTKVLLEFFGEDRQLDTIKTADVDAFKLSLKRKGNSQATINHALVALSMVFKIAIERDGAVKKPTLGIQGATRGRIRWLSEEEEEVILTLLTTWGKPDLHDWTCVLIDTGMRPSETKKMTGAWVDFRGGAIHVGESKTEDGVRTIPMTKRVKAILERRCLLFPKGFLFPYGWQTYQAAWQDIRKAMKMEDEKDFVAYSTRHTFATRLAQRGERVEVIQRLMGHKDPKQTMVYAKLGAAQFVSAIAKLEKPEPVLK